MDSFDWNRLAAASVLSICVLASSWGVGYALISNTTPASPAFTVGDNTDDMVDLTKADIPKGKNIAAQQCSLCHTFVKDEPNKIGPNLYNIMRRPIAALSNFTYSDSLKKHHNENWDTEKLNHWLQNPDNFAQGTIMAYPGVTSKQDRANIIAYLQSLSPQPPNNSNQKTKDN